MSTGVFKLRLFLGIHFSSSAYRFGEKILDLSIDRSEIIIGPTGEFFPKGRGDPEQYLFSFLIFL